MFFFSICFYISYIFYVSTGLVGKLRMCWVGRAEGWTVVMMGAIVAGGGSCVRGSYVWCECYGWDRNKFVVGTCII